MLIQNILIYISPTLELPFHPLNRLFHKTQDFNLDDTQLTGFFLLWVWLLGSSLRTPGPVLDPKDDLLLSS